ncbi:hypothetical protein ACPPVW_08685 [Leifsonia sp. McL0607]|uniref:hypothetical protein n=1 Tax=Leifsonia sp. McL0607 TaxID=3415672 RepID=UPI003CF6A9C8
MRVDGLIDADAELTVQRIASALVDVTHAESVVMSAVATTEAYVDATIQRLVDEASVQRSLFGKFMVERSTAGFKQSWVSRQDVLRDGFGIVIEPQKLVQHLTLVVEIRNVLAHGDGLLTSLQTANWSRAIELRRNLERKLGVLIDGRRVTITQNSVRISTRILIDYVLALGAATAVLLNDSNSKSLPRRT